MTVLLGYAPRPDWPACPFCGDRHFALDDDGHPDTYKVRCWCGATARVAKDDPDIVALLSS